MTDFADLAMRVDTSDLAKGERAQDSFGRKAEQTERKTTKATTAIASGFRRMLPAIGAAIGALGAGVGFAAAIREAEMFQTTMFRVEQVIRATGGAAGRSADQLRAQARELALGTLESTEGILRAQQTLLTFRQVQGDVFDRAIVAAADMTAALGGDLNSATLQLAKALENPLEGISALSRSGTVFTQSQKDMVRAMVEAGQTAEAQAFILDELEAQYKGTAQAAAGGLAGAQDTLSQAMQEFKLVIGDALLPIMTNFVNVAADAVNGITNFIISIGNGIRRVHEFVNPMNDLEVATSNVVLAMADEIQQSQQLSIALGHTNAMSVEAARVKLEEARGRHENVTAIIAEHRANALLTDAYAQVSTEIDRVNEGLRSISAAPDTLLNAGKIEQYDVLEQTLVRLRNEQMNMLRTDEAMSDQAKLTAENIAKIEEALAGATGGMVSFGDELITPVELSERLGVSLGSAGAAMSDLTPQIDRATDAVQDMGRSVRNDLSDAWQDFIDGGLKDFDSFARSILKTFGRMLAQMILLGKNNPIQIGASMGGAGGIMGALGGAQGGLAGMANSALAGVGGMAGLGSAVMGGASFLGSGIASGFAAGGVGGAISGGASAFATAMSGATMGLGGAAAALGAAIPVIGAVALVVGAFRTKTKELDNGLRLTVDGLDATAETFRKIEKSKFFGLSKSRSTSFRDDPDNPILGAVSEIQGSISDAANVLGFGANIFDDFAFRFQLSLKGLSEDQRIAKINEQLSIMGDEFATLVPGMSSMNEVLNAANQAVMEAGQLGASRFESQMLMAARRRGEFDVVGAGPGATNTADLIRLRNMDDATKTTADNSAKQSALLERLLRIWERFEIDGVPQGPTVA